MYPRSMSKLKKKKWPSQDWKSVLAQLINLEGDPLIIGYLVVEVVRVKPARYLTKRA